MKPIHDVQSVDSGARSRTVSRRGLLSSAGALGLTALAGCGGVGGGSEPTEISALLPSSFLPARERIVSNVDGNVELSIDIPTSEERIFNLMSEDTKKYDFAILANEFVPALQEAGVLAPVDTDVVSSWSDMYGKFKEDAREDFGDSEGVYGVPLFFDWIGYGYHTEFIPDHDPSWSAVFQDTIGDASLENSVVMLNDHQPVIAAGLIHIGMRDALDDSRLELSEDALAEINSTLSEQANTILRASTPPAFHFNASDPSFTVGQTYRGGWLALLSSDENLAPGDPWEFARPSGGALTWYQTAVVSADSDNKDLTWQVVDSMASGPAGAQLSLELLSNSTNPTVEDHLESVTPSDDDIASFEHLNPTERYGALPSSVLEDLVLMPTVTNEDAWETTFDELVTAWQEGSSCELC